MQEHLFEHFESEGNSGLLGNVSITLINKTDDGKDPKKRENYWMMTLRNYIPFGLNTEDSVWAIPWRSINVTSGITLVFFDILVRPGIKIAQDFSDMTYIFFCIYYIVYFFIIKLLLYVTYFYVYIIC